MNDVDSSRIAIVGGGLVGSLLAIFLSRRGHDVVVYERRPDIRNAEAEAGRSINLVLTRRGLRALERVGLAERALELTVPVTGRMIHSPSGDTSFQPYGRDESECNHSISRAVLNEFLVREAALAGARLRFRSRLVDADLGSGRLRFDDTAGGDRSEARAGVVFGADGAGSAVREAFRAHESFEESVEMLGHGYKELLIPRAEGGGWRIEAHALHVWPRGERMLMALPNLDGSFTLTLYLPLTGEHGFERIDSADRVVSLFQEQFPDAVGLIPDLAASFLANPTGNLGTVRCRPWAFRDRALLIGDAAHAIVPFFGQGMNAGFEDCAILDELLGPAAGEDWGAAFAEFDRRRKPDAEAIADMALENFDEMRAKVGDPAFLLRKQVEHRLEHEMPREYRSRYSMVMYSSIPYGVALEAGRLQQTILDELCRGITSAADIDLSLARRLVRQRLAPFLLEEGVSLDY